jgi:hypothetical protein
MANACTSLSGQIRGRASKFLTDNNFFDWHEDLLWNKDCMGQ